MHLYTCFESEYRDDDAIDRPPLADKNSLASPFEGCLGLVGGHASESLVHRFFQTIEKAELKETKGHNGANHC